MSLEIKKRQFANYDFGLSAEEEARAARLHAESIIIDMMYWGPCTYLSFDKEMEEEINAFWETNRDPTKTNIFGIYQPMRLAVRQEFSEFKSCWEASGVTAGNRETYGFLSFEEVIFTFGNIIAMFDNLPWVVKALRADDIRQAKAEGKHAEWIGTQLVRGIERNFIDLIEPAYNLGLRMIQLTYNLMNLIGAGCTERTDAGVSNYGAKVISLMNQLGIVVDTAHCGRQTTLDACKLSNRPVVASHTAAQGVYYHARGKSDEEIRAIADTGGVIGVCTVPFFLAPGKGVSIDAMFDHIDYIASFVGWEHVALGTDWPIALPKSILQTSFAKRTSEGGESGFRKEDKIDPLSNLVGFDDYRDFPNITRGLVRRGYSDGQIKGILGENFLRVFKDVCG